MPPSYGDSSGPAVDEWFDGSEVRSTAGRLRVGPGCGPDGGRAKGRIWVELGSAQLCRAKDEKGGGGPRVTHP